MPAQKQSGSPLEHVKHKAQTINELMKSRSDDELSEMFTEFHEIADEYLENIDNSRDLFHFMCFRLDLQLQWDEYNDYDSLATLVSKLTSKQKQLNSRDNQKRKRF